MVLQRKGGETINEEKRTYRNHRLISLDIDRYYEQLRIVFARIFSSSLIRLEIVEQFDRVVWIVILGSHFWEHQLLWRPTLPQPSCLHLMFY